MRWEQLFGDLDSQFEGQAEAEVRAELADRQRHAMGTVTAAQRYAGAIGAELQVRLRGGQAVRGTMRDVGPDWLLLATASGEVLIATRAVTAVSGLNRATGTPLSPVEERFTLRLALRGIARDRAPVVITVLGSGRDGGTEIFGTIDRIGADFLELAEHAIFEPRRAAMVRSVALIPLDAIDSVRAHSVG